MTKALNNFAELDYKYITDWHSNENSVSSVSFQFTKSSNKIEMKSTVACLLVLIVSVQCQWLNNFGYGLNPAGYYGGFYPDNGIHTGYTGFPASAGPFYGHPGQFVNYPAASLPSYDAFGNQVGGYGQVQDTPEVAQAKAAHFAAHAAARAHLIAPVAAVPIAEVAVAATPIVAPVESVAVATPISRKKRQIPLSQNSPFAYGFNSPLAYNNYGTPFGYNYGAPFGFHYANPLTSNNQYYPYPDVNNLATPTLISRDAATTFINIA